MSEAKIMERVDVIIGPLDIGRPKRCRMFWLKSGLGVGTKRNEN